MAVKSKATPRGGYIICARCTMKLADAKPQEKSMSPDDFIKAIEDGLVKEFRKGLNVTQEAFSQKIGISRKILVNIERNLYIPSTKLQMKMYRKIKKYTSVGIEHAKICVLLVL